MVKDAVLALLEQSRGKVISGSVLAQQLQVSRTAVWKAIERLRQQGISIEASPGGGYCLRQEDDTLTVSAIKSILHTKQIGRQIVIIPQTDSTNALLKREYADHAHGFTLIAEAQTAGRGRLGRSFCSPAGQGLYCSILLRLALPLAQLHFITIAAAVAVCNTITKACGFTPQIKWVNDILHQNKKLCGILTEASIEGETGQVAYTVLGIGINVCGSENFPEELRDIAGTLADFTQTPPRRAVLAATLLCEVEACCTLLLENRHDELLDAYRAHSCVLGQKIRVLGDGTPYDAVAGQINKQGHLCVRKPDGTQHILSAGEISVRL